MKRTLEPRFRWKIGFEIPIPRAPRHTRSLLAVLALPLLLIACDESHSGDSPTNDEIIFGLLGPLMKIKSLASVQATHDIAKNTTTTSFSSSSMSDSSQKFFFQADIVTPGELNPGDYTETTPGLSCTIGLTNGGAFNWAASAGGGNNSGSFTLHITKVTTLYTSGGISTYKIKGTLDATIPPVTATGATGTETATIDFSAN